MARILNYNRSGNRNSLKRRAFIILLKKVIKGILRIFQKSYLKLLFILVFLTFGITFIIFHDYLSFLGLMIASLIIVLGYLLPIRKYVKILSRKIIIISKSHILRFKKFILNILSVKKISSHNFQKKRQEKESSQNR